jgi:predicted  nucleic acid-binding Zn-ribbon protein
MTTAIANYEREKSGLEMRNAQLDEDVARLCVQSVEYQKEIHDLKSRMVRVVSELGKAKAVVQTLTMHGQMAPPASGNQSENNGGIW